MPGDRIRNFSSDNHAGICPEAWQAMQAANEGHVDAYGSDSCTTKVCDRFRELFETNCEVFFAFNGTAANSLALASMCQPYHSVICHQLSHVETDECGGPEFYSGGSKVLHVDGSEGKLDAGSVEAMATQRTDMHFPKARVLSLTQSTEVGTVYKPEDIAELSDTAKRLDLGIHMDGARYANALATLECSPKEISWQVGVDILCLGGTKNGLAFGEVILFFNHALSQEFEYRLKQAGQLNSKMRFVSAPWLAMLENEVWLKNAQNANAAAQRLEKGLKQLEVEILFPVEANCVFAKLSDRLIAGMLYRGWKFYDFIAAGGCRLMCSWDTTTEDVDGFLADMKELVGNEEDRSGEVEILRH